MPGKRIQSVQSFSVNTPPDQPLPSRGGGPTGLFSVAPVQFQSRGAAPSVGAPSSGGGAELLAAALKKLLKKSGAPDADNYETYGGEGGFSRNLPNSPYGLTTSGSGLSDYSAFDSFYSGSGAPMESFGGFTPAEISSLGISIPQL